MTRDDWTDSEVISAIRSFALSGFEEAGTKWAAGKYSKNDGSPEDHNQRREGYHRWVNMKRRAGELINLIPKDAASSAP